MRGVGEALAHEGYHSPLVGEGLAHPLAYELAHQWATV